MSPYHAMVLLAGDIAQGDCESIDRGLIAQPVNAVTSLGFAVVGVWLMGRREGEPQRTRICRVAFGTLLIVMAVGSVMYHGPQPSWARFVHDLSNAAVAWALIGYDLGELRRMSLAAMATVVLSGIAVLGALFLAYPDAGTRTTEVLVATVLVLEFLAHSRRDGFAAWRRDHSMRHLAAAVLAGVAVAAYLIGRTGSPLCRPDGLLQPHGLWHLLTAVAIGLVADAAFARSKRAGVAAA